MPFEVFPKYGGKMNAPDDDSQPLVTIGIRGHLYLNESAYALLGRAEYVELLFDVDRGLMGLRPTSRRKGYRFNGTKSTATLSALLFCRRFSIPLNNRRVVGAWLEGDVLCFQVTA